MQEQPVMHPSAHPDACLPAASLALQQHQTAAALDMQTNSATDATVNHQHKQSGAAGLDQQDNSSNATVSAGDGNHALQHQLHGSKAASTSQGQLVSASADQQESDSAAANDQQHGALENGVPSASTSHSQQERDSAAASHQQHSGLDNGVSSASTSHSQQGAAAQDLEGVMIGRQAFYQTWNCLADADRAVFGAATNVALSRRQVSCQGITLVFRQLQQSQSIDSDGDGRT